jgi:hypothetical protein
MGGRQRAATIGLAALGVLFVAELVVRVRPDAVPPHQIWPTMQMQLQDERIRALSDDDGASVVFLGTSSVGVSIDPSEMRNLPSGTQGFNAGVGGATLSWVGAWARRAVLPRLGPETIVLGLTPLEVSAADRWRAVDERFSEFLGVRRLLGTATPIEVAESYLERSSKLFDLRTLLRQPKVFGSFIGVADLPEGHPPSRVAAPDGQVLLFEARRYRNLPFVQRRDRRDLAGRYQLREPELLALRRVVTDLSGSAARLVIVSMPVTEDYLTALPSGRDDKVRFDRALRSVADRVGARFVNAGVWPRTQFADPAHVNAVGSRRITALIDGVLGEDRPPAR